MDLYMPSEIARLVLGYLHETGCLQTGSVFLNESSHLLEYTTYLKQGVEYPTKIHGQSLLDILSESSSKRNCPRERNTSPAMNEPGSHDEHFVQMRGLLKRLERSMAQLISLMINSARMRTTSAYTRTDRHPSQSSKDVSSGIPTGTVSRSSVSVATSPLHESESIIDLANGVEIVSNNVPTIRIEEASSSGASDHVVDAATAATCGNSNSVDNMRNSSPPAKSSATPLDLICCSRVAHGSQMTPTSRPIDIFSSPTSIARSALIFSLGIEALETPVKEIDDNANGKSPRRKNQLPRKRLTYTPSVSAKKRNQQVRGSLVTAASVPMPLNGDHIIHTEESVGVSELFGQLLNSTALHECIAANINKVVCSAGKVGDMQSTSNSESQVQQDQFNTAPESSLMSSLDAAKAGGVPAAKDSQTKPSELASSSTEHFVPDNVVKDIVDRTESDPLFEAFINIFFDKHEGNPQVSDQSCETSSPESARSPLTCNTILANPASHSHNINTPSSGVMVAHKDNDKESERQSIDANYNLHIENTTVKPPLNKSPDSLSTQLTPNNPPAFHSSEIRPLYSRAPPNNFVPIVDPKDSVEPQLIELERIDVNEPQGVITGSGAKSTDDGDERLPRTMMFTILEPMSTLNVPGMSQDPGNLTFVTLSPSQLRSLNDCNVGGFPTIKETTHSVREQAHKERNIPNDQDSLENSIKAHSKPKRRLFTYKKACVKSAENDVQKQPPSHVTAIRPKPVCAVPLNFSNPNVATTVRLLKPIVAKQPLLQSAVIAKKVSESTTKNVNPRSPHLRSLLTQSSHILNRRKIVASKPDQNHVRVLSFDPNFVPVSISSSMSATTGSVGLLPTVATSSVHAKSSKLTFLSTSTKNTSTVSHEHGALISGASSNAIISSPKVITHRKSNSNGAVKRKASDDTSKQDMSNGKQKTLAAESDEAQRKRSKTGSVLATMDVEKFLSTVQYAE